MSYPEFLVQWYNWPYLLALVIAIASLARPPALAELGAALGGILRLEQLSGLTILRTFSVCVAIVGLTVNGAIHDYWRRAQESAFAPALLLTVFLAVVFTRAIGGVLQRHFPRIRDVRWGGSNLSGERGRVVSRAVSPDYRAGRAQVMGADDTLYIVLCKTREEEIPYGVEVELGDFDTSDGRYFVTRAESEISDSGQDI